MRRQSKSNHRVFKRTRTRIPVSLLVGPSRDKSALPASIVQTSFLGARVKTKRTLKPGQAVSLVRMTGACCDIPSKVVWVGKQGTNSEGQAGLVYTHPLNARITPEN